MTRAMLPGDYCHDHVWVKTEAKGVMLETEGVEVDHWIFLSSDQAQQLRLFLESLDVEKEASPA